MPTSKTAVTVDILLFRKRNEIEEILLIKRKNDPFKDSWAIPGGFVDEHEDLAVAAKRELWEETQIRMDELEQLHAFGKPHRDPRGHTVSIAFTGFTDEKTVATAADDASEARWFRLDDLPAMAFDHQDIITYAMQKM